MSSNSVFAAATIIFLVTLTRTCEVQYQTSFKVSGFVGAVAGQCKGKELAELTLDEKRGVCVLAGDIDTHCNIEHKAWQVNNSKIVVNQCVPVPDENDKYYVVERTNVKMTCDGGAITEKVNFKYVNATKCTCRHLGLYNLPASYTYTL